MSLHISLRYFQIHEIRTIHFIHSSLVVDHKRTDLNIFACRNLLSFYTQIFVCKIMLKSFVKTVKIKIFIQVSTRLCESRCVNKRAEDQSNAYDRMISRIREDRLASK